MDDQIEVGEDALTIYNLQYPIVERDQRLDAVESEPAPAIGNSATPEPRDDTVSTEPPKNTVRESTVPPESPTTSADETPQTGYSREEMMRIQNDEGYSWHRNTEEDSLAIMTRWLHDESRRRDKVKSEEYWIWHNANNQSASARLFGFFPLLLPHFDTAGFAEAARNDSPVLRYLRSELLRKHLTLREQCEGTLTLEERTNCGRLVILECPLAGYTRDQVVALGNTKRAPNIIFCSYLNRLAFATVRNENNDCVYSRGAMRTLSKYPNYNWNKDKPVHAPLQIWTRNFSRVKREKKLHRAEYWIWHNMNAQQSFAVYWGFFPFHLPHFDAESFISVARPDSLVPSYLISRLFQQHLILREEKELVPYQKEHADEQRRKMITAYQKIAKFPLTDEHSLVYYEDPERNLQSCSLEHAMDNLRAGFFTSQMKFVVAPKGEAVRDKEWMVFELSDLIARNGKSMPFLHYLPCHTDKMNEKEEINQMRMEMLELNSRRAKVEGELQNLGRRAAAVNKEMQQIAEGFPILAKRSAQTNATLSIATKFDAFQPSHPQFTPKPGVDPFAMLKPISNQRLHNSKTPKIIGGDEIVKELDRLRKRFDRCDKKALVLRTANMINKSRPASCQFCDLKMESASAFIEHITCRKHLNKISAVGTDALDFWFDAIKEVTKSEMRISPLAILSFYNGLANPHPNLEQAAATMNHKLKHCDKKVLDGEQALRALFNSPVTCSVCIRRVSIDKPANLIAHFATQGHISAATNRGGQMHADVIDFWTRALDRAS